MSPQASFFETVFAQSMDYGATDLLRYAVKTGCRAIAQRQASQRIITSSFETVLDRHFAALD